MTDDMLKRADEEVDTIRAALKSLGYLRIEEGKGAVLMELLQELSTRVREQEEELKDEEDCRPMTMEEVEASTKAISGISDAMLGIAKPIQEHKELTDAK